MFPVPPWIHWRLRLLRKAGNYTWLTYKEVYDTVIKVGAAIRSCGVGKVQTFVLIIALRPSIPRSWNCSSFVPYFHYSL